MDPVVVALATNDAGRPLAIEQPADRLNLQMAGHEVPAGAIGVLGALGQPYGRARVHPSQLGHRSPLTGLVFSQVPVNLFVNVGREQIIGVGATGMQGKHPERVVPCTLFNHNLSGERVLGQVVRTQNLPAPVRHLRRQLS